MKERRAGLVVSKNAVQLYHVTQYGLEPDDVTETLSDWQIVTPVDDYDFITRRTGVYMRCSVAKKDLSSAEHLESFKSSKRHQKVDNKHVLCHFTLFCSIIKPPLIVVYLSRCFFVRLVQQGDKK